MTVKYLKLFWYQIFVHQNLKLLDFLADFVLKRMGTLFVSTVKIIEGETSVHIMLQMG